MRRAQAEARAKLAEEAAEVKRREEEEERAAEEGRGEEVRSLAAQLEAACGQAYRLSSAVQEKDDEILQLQVRRIPGPLFFMACREKCSLVRE